MSVGDPSGSFVLLHRPIIWQGWGGSGAGLLAAEILDAPCRRLVLMETLRSKHVLSPLPPESSQNWGEDGKQGSLSLWSPQTPAIAKMSSAGRVACYQEQGLVRP